jgi:hypothetical protein
MKPVRSFLTIRSGAGPVATASFSKVSFARRSDLRAVVLVAVGVAGALATSVTVLAVANGPILVDRSGDGISQASHRKDSA